MDAGVQRVRDDMERIRVGEQGVEENQEGDEQANTQDDIYA